MTILDFFHDRPPHSLTMQTASHYCIISYQCKAPVNACFEEVFFLVGSRELFIKVNFLAGVILVRTQFQNEHRRVRPQLLFSYIYSVHNNS